ncbi:response regulator [Candidatus Fermentibacterales bacterium]|nr:response regulator [Candidatus Fermentibacterales bacterium]
MITVLWVDDEIDHLKSHVHYLEKRGLRVLTARSGQQALESLRSNPVDLVLMDQMMIGMDGLETMDRIRENYQELPVVMVTQSEEEELMDRALGGSADDYLTKPVNPSQILLVVKRLLMVDKLRSERAAEEVAQEAARVRDMEGRQLDWEDWVSLFRIYNERDVSMQGILGENSSAARNMDLRGLAGDFSRTVERMYPTWISSSNGPIMPHRFFEKVIVPSLGRSNELVLIVMDCMRYDQWLTIAPYLETLFHQEIRFMFVNLPSATPYSRNALFAGALPRDIWRYYRHHWTEDHTRPGLNAHESEHMKDTLKRLGSRAAEGASYFKVSNHYEGEQLRRSLSHLLKGGFLALVVNYLDHLTHGRSELDLLKDLAPDRVSFRELAGTWFRNSFLLEVLKTLAARGATVIVTSDHGSTFARRPTHIRGARGMSSSMRYRVGHSLTADDRAAIVIRQPAEYGLPDEEPSKTYVLARSDYLLVHPQMPRGELQKFVNTFQHGGVSPDEMIVPCVTLTPKRVS